jgi:hypothetical protein
MKIIDTKEDKTAFAGSVWDVRPRELWLQLFNLYVAGGAPLNGMQNMLIDLDNCKEVFDRIRRYTDKAAFRYDHEKASFYWGFDEGGRWGCTRWRWREDVKEEWVLCDMGTDHSFLFEVTENGYKWSKLSHEMGEEDE